MPDPTLIALQPSDASLLRDREGHPQLQPRPQPANDGKLIRIPVPQLTEERRKNLVKVAHKQPRKARSRSATCAATSTTTSRS